MRKMKVWHIMMILLVLAVTACNKTPIPELPEYLHEVFQPIIEKLMAKSPEDRYQNGEDIIKALNNISDDTLDRFENQIPYVYQLIQGFNKENSKTKHLTNQEKI